ncbi:hypothetical protein, partial [Staphylococcus aureus]|uniref:hypothetical protein n=1 Tax=Staphylococcus aureus TaxID=1280 RepID=UPI0039BE510A
RLAEIAKQRAALDAEEREIRVILGDVPPAPTVNPLRDWGQSVFPLLPPMTYYRSTPVGPGMYGWEVLCGTTTGCAVPT